MSSAAVRVGDEVTGRIERGLLILAGAEVGDEPAQVEAAAAKIAGLRIFADREGRTNLTCSEVGGAVLVVSQFTLFADLSRGRRPSFARAARPELAAPLLDRLVDQLRAAGLPTATGRFGAEMRIACELDGPFTLTLDFPAVRSTPEAEAVSFVQESSPSGPHKENQ